jgi:4'-phosphopantetheinyl transferase EntD
VVVLRALLPAAVRVAESGEPTRWRESSLRVERAAVAAASDRRRIQHGEVRELARVALAELGVGPVSILTGEGGGPRWPAGVVGSLTHADAHCAAAVASTADVLTLGIDVEEPTPLRPRVAARVCTALELGRLPALEAVDPTTPWTMVLFSVKEAIYKAWHPVTGRWLGFRDVDVVCRPDGTFTVSVLVDAPPPLAVMSGRFAATDRVVAAALVVPADQ